MLVFYTMLYLSITKNYVRLSLFFVIGMAATVLTVLLWSIFRFPFHMETTYALLLAMTIGFTLIAALEIALVKSFFRKNSGNWKPVLKHMKKYWRMILINSLYTLGLYVHNFVFWTTDLRNVLPADDPFLAHEDPVLDYIDLPDGSATLIYPKGAEDAVASTNPLAFNLQMIQEANLEDPRDLYERGEWTWDKFREYCQILTKDIDGDDIIDVYGYGAWIGDALPAWYMSNGTYMAATPTENLSSSEIGETLKFLQDLWLTDKVAYPIPAENGWDVCRYLYRDKKVAFTTTAVWIMANYDDYNWDGKAESTLDFDMVFVPYPIGPSGNAETNNSKIASGNYWMLPAGVKDPKLVFDVFRAYQNWYHDDVTLRDDPEELEWWYTATSDKLDIQNWNFSVLEKLGSKKMVDFYNSFSDSLPILEFLNGEYTPAQFQETYRQTVQDALDQIFQ
jgi:hypothetical protein